MTVAQTRASSHRRGMGPHSGETPRGDRFPWASPGLQVADLWPGGFSCCHRLSLALVSSPVPWGKRAHAPGGDWKGPEMRHLHPGGRAGAPRLSHPPLPTRPPTPEVGLWAWVTLISALFFSVPKADPAVPSETLRGLQARGAAWGSKNRRLGCGQAWG